MTAASTTAPSPSPEHFPITWSRPELAELSWFQDLMHNPLPVTPLTGAIHATAFSTGTTRAIKTLSMPVIALHQAVQNHYIYLAAEPFVGTPEEFEARFGEMQAILGGLMPGFLERFYSEYVPRIVAYSDRNRDTNWDAMSLQELCAAVLALHDAAVELWDIHMQINVPAMLAAFGFSEFLAGILGEDIERTGHLMLQGFPNKSIETGHAFWQLAQDARSDAALVDTLRTAPAEELRDRLSSFAAGRDFLTRWEAFLKEYGWRSGGFEFADVSWFEDWSGPLTQLRSYLGSDSEDPLESQRRQAVERDRLVAEVAEKLPPEVLPVFHMLLAGAQTYIPIAEDHNFYIDQQAFTTFRLPILALGRALASAGVIDTPDDVFYLDLDEIAAIKDGDLASRATVVASRRASHARARGIVPPELIGTAPSPDEPPNPLLTKFFGIGHGLQSDARVLRGIPSSAGTVTGTVKVVRTLAEADKIEPGDILVCHMTMPAWTPLFATVAAVVADSGGVLSHCSIVAREYGLPCVTATRVGTRLLKDGQTVTVDGTRGIVRVV